MSDDRLIRFDAAIATLTPERARDCTCFRVIASELSFPVDRDEASS